MKQHTHYTQHTPYEINLLLHFYTTPLEYEHNNTELYKITVNKFLTAGLIQQRNLSNRYAKYSYECTERGGVLIEMWCNTPLPKQIWTDPRIGDTK